MNRIIKTLAGIASIALLSAPGALAAPNHWPGQRQVIANLSHPHVHRANVERVVLSETLTANHDQTVCSTQTISREARVTIQSVTANGYDLTPGQPGGLLQYFDGHGTFVRLALTKGAGPACMRGLTWLPTANLKIVLRVS